MQKVKMTCQLHAQVQSGQFLENTNKHNTRLPHARHSIIHFKKRANGWTNYVDIIDFLKTDEVAGDMCLFKLM